MRKKPGAGMTTSPTKVQTKAQLQQLGIFCKRGRMVWIFSRFTFEYFSMRAVKEIDHLASKIFELIGKNKVCNPEGFQNLRGHKLYL